MDERARGVGQAPLCFNQRMTSLQERKELAGPALERGKRALIGFVKRLLKYPWKIFTLPLKELQGDLLSLRAAAVESMAYVGVELRRLGDLVEAGASDGSERATAGPAPSAALNGAATRVVEVPFAFRSLAGVSAPANILIVGPGGHAAGRSLAAFGYDVTIVDPAGAPPEHPRLELVREPLSQWDAGEHRFKAILQMGSPQPLEGPELERAADLLEDGGILVMSLPFGFPGAAAYDEDALAALPAGWEVSEQALVASTGHDEWAPVVNGTAPERGMALLAARRTGSTG